MSSLRLAEKKIHTKSFGNVETERLQARLEWLRCNLTTVTQDESRETFRGRVREIVNCERGADAARDRLRSSEQRPTSVDVVAVPLIRPFTRADTVYVP